MFQYTDGNGNVFVLENEDTLSLCLLGTAAKGPQAGATMPMERMLNPEEYMDLISAFSLAIDNKLCQCELRSKGNGMITATENGLQRRYILASDCKELLELEGLLWTCFREQ